MTSLDVAAVLGGTGVGIVIGWLAPTARLLELRVVAVAVVVSAGIAVALYLLAGLPAAVAGVSAIAIGAWLHAMFLEHVAATTAAEEA